MSMYHAFCPYVPLHYSKQIRAGYRCITCSRQAHLARRLQLCRTEVDGLYSDAVAQTKATVSRRKSGWDVSIAGRSSVGVAVSVDDDSVYSRVSGAGGVGAGSGRVPTAHSLSNSVLTAKKTNGATAGGAHASQSKMVGSGARRTVSLNKELRL
jgi:hypothetical protein